MRIVFVFSGTILRLRVYVVKCLKSAVLSPEAYITDLICDMIMRAYMISRPSDAIRTEDYVLQATRAVTTLVLNFLVGGVLTIYTYMLNNSNGCR